jgi:PHD/YefM family antitoxin component YafN of YafNO toxin-antitoxin module
MGEMIRISEAEAERAFRVVADKALTAPVAVTKDGRDHVVVVSAEDFACMTRSYRRAYLTCEIPEEILAEVEAARMDPKHDHLNARMDDGAK